MMQTRAKSFVLYAGLLVGIILSMFPFYWLIVMATRTTSDIYRFPPQLWFGSHFLDNITRVLQQINFAGAFFNTLFVAGSVTLLVLFFDSLAGFAFAKFDFPGKKSAIYRSASYDDGPFTTFACPLLCHDGLLWMGRYVQSAYHPGMVNAFGIFWIRQYAEESIPKELLDAGRMDGCSFFDCT